MNKSDEFNLDFPRAYALKRARGVIKQQAEDFYVEENLFPELMAQGEHVWLCIEKLGQNTEYVAERIAVFAGVKTMDVGFSGLKDRWARTRQWFSVYLGVQPEPDWSQLNLDGVRVLQYGRNQKKLRRGEHRGNSFVIRIRALENTNELEAGLEKIKQEGFPNYFGPQRFGLRGANLERGQRFFEGKIKASRSQRGFYLSAARSYLFNLNLASTIQDGTWQNQLMGGPLYGDEGVGDGIPEERRLSEPERVILAAHPVFAAAIHKNRLKLERRPYVIIPEDLTWQIDESGLELSFSLPSGCFATALIAELVEVDLGLGVS